MVEGFTDLVGEAVDILAKLFVVERVLLGALVDLLGYGVIDGVFIGQLLHIVDLGRQHVGGLGVEGILALDVEVQHSVRKHELVELEDCLFIASLFGHEGIDIEHFLLLALSDMLDLDVASIDAPLLEVKEML